MGGGGGGGGGGVQNHKPTGYNFVLYPLYPPSLYDRYMLEFLNGDMISLTFSPLLQVTSLYEEFKFGRVLALMQKFLSDLSKFYITTTKDR